MIGRVQDQEDGIVIQNVVTSKDTNATLTNVGIGASTKATPSGNTVIGSTRDGFDVYNDHNVTVSNSLCRGSQPGAGAHPDCVQLLSVKKQAIESDIKVIDNIAPGNTHGFTLFASDNNGGLRITMTGNIINGLQPQGIACYGCIDSVISGNFLSPEPGAAHFVNLNHYLGINNTIADNSFVQLKDAFILPRDYGAAYFQLTGAQYHPSPSITSAAEVAGLGGNFAANTQPEPGQWALLIVGFAATGIVQRRRSRWGVAVTA